MHSDFSLLDSTVANTRHPTVIEAQESQQARPLNGAERVSDSPTPLDDELREQAITRAAALVEYLHAVYSAYEALWHKHGDFTAKAAFDQALADHHKAIELRESLMRGRKQEALRA